MIDICNGPPIENGLHNLCLAPAVPYLYLYYSLNKFKTNVGNFAIFKSPSASSLVTSSSLQKFKLTSPRASPSKHGTNPNASPSPLSYTGGHDMIRIVLYFPTFTFHKSAKRDSKNIWHVVLEMKKATPISLLFSTGIFLNQIVCHSTRVLLIQLDHKPICSNLLARAASQTD